MNMKASKVVMKCMGGALAVCSAVAMAGGYLAAESSSGKKMVKKTAHKLSDFVDTMANML